MRPGSRPLSQRVVITGLGAVACCGIGKDAFWEAVRDGKSGISLVDLFDVGDLPCKIGGQVRGFDPLDYIESKKARRQGRFVHFAVAAARQAFDDASLEPVAARAPASIGVAFGSSGAGHGNIADDMALVWKRDGIGAVPTSAANEIPVHAAAAHIAMALGLTGPNSSASTGCATGILTIAHGAALLRDGSAHAMLVGGTEASLGPSVFSLLARQRVLSGRNDAPEQAVRPYDKDGDGLVIGDGAGAVVLETAAHALDRGARVYAEVLGWGMSCEAYHMVLCRTDGEDMARALREAMALGRVGPTDIDYVCAHGIGNRQFDLADTNGLKLALGAHAHRVAVSSIKPVTAQAFAASGALQTVASCMAMATQTIPPTINHSIPAPECDLDYVPGACRRGRLDTVAVNAHSFGGTHAALVLRRFDPSP